MPRSTTIVRLTCSSRTGCSDRPSERCRRRGEPRAGRTVYVGTIISTNVQEVLGAPEYVFPSRLAFIGYPDEDLPLRPHLPLNDIVHRNRYNIPTDEEVNTFSSERDAQ